MHLEADEFSVAKRRGVICKIYHLEMMQKIDNILRSAMLVVAFLLPLLVHAQEDSVTYRREWTDYRVSVDYKVNATVIDPNYRNNSTVVARVDSILTKLRQDSTITIEAVLFSGSASPEGNLQANKRLSRARMLAMEQYVRQHIDFDDDIVTYDDRYVDWDQLIEFVEADTTLPNRDAVLKICRSSYAHVPIHNGRSVDGRIPQIRKLDNGKTWSEMLKRYFVKMRTATVTLKTYIDVPVIVERPQPVEEPVEEVADVAEERPEELLQGEDVAETADVGISEPSQPTPRMSVKTNLLAYSTLIPNTGVEFYLAPHWSAEITAMYSPFDLFRYNLKTRVLVAKPEVRYWFDEAMRQGHFIGLHIPIAGFNIQLDDNFRYQDPKRALWGVGLNYGYALLWGDENQWSLDFTFGLGYMDVRYNVYEGVRNGKYVRSEMKHYFGPTRVGVNLSYIINQKRGK